LSGHIKLNCKPICKSVGLIQTFMRHLILPPIYVRYRSQVRWK